MKETQFNAQYMTADGIPAGIYTVEDRGTGKHHTFRLALSQRGTLAGKWILSYLRGPDNEESYEGFAFVRYDLGLGRANAFLWRRFEGSIKHTHLIAVFNSSICSTRNLKDKLLAEGAGHVQIEGPGCIDGHPGYRVHLARNCVRCGRLLTVPESILIGMGPECAMKHREWAEDHHARTWDGTAKG